ncbi:MAG: S-layer homology domain-containing protein, partial [Oscillospiraceae bacterium]|nr:S-layer homology domain-containing protein [Oscillospiraceae bacterium]
MKKRCMSILLAFCMAWTLFPASTLAEMSDGDAVPIIAEADATSPDEASAESAALSDAGGAMTRGAWMRELVNLFGLTLKKDEYPDVYFPDIGESDYFDAIMIATKYGFVDVDAGENFEPDNPITREFAVHTLNFYLGIQNDRDGFTFSDSDKTEYPDDAQVALDIEWLSAVDGKFSPEEIVTAEESSEMLRKAKEIHDSRTASNPVSNYEFADYVKTIPESVDVDSEIDYDTGIRTLTISGYQETLAKGDTFVYYYEGLAFVLTADKVDERDGVLTVVTTDPPSDAIIKYEFAGVIQPEIIEVVPAEEPVTLQCADGDTVTFGPVELLAVTKYGPIKFNRDVFKSNGVKGTLSGKIDNIKLDTTIFSKDKHIRLTGDVTATCSVEFDLLNDPAAKNLHLCDIGLEGFGSVSLELSLKWEAKFGFNLFASFEVGAFYEDGHGSSKFEWNVSDDSCFFADGTISAQLQLAARLYLAQFV